MVYLSSLQSSSSNNSSNMESIARGFSALKAALLGSAAVAILLMVVTLSVGGVDEARFQLAFSTNILRRWKCPGGGYAQGLQKGKVICLKCPTGHYCLGGFMPKRPCPRGKYQNYEGQKFCFPALPGTYVANRGSKRAVKCPRGKFQPAIGRKRCIPASAGHMVPNTGARTQRKCWAGFFQNRSGQSSCKKAPAGKFVAKPGATRATPCEAGFYNGAVGQTGCRPASPGYHVASKGQKKQMACGKNTYQPSAGQTGCMQCPRGFTSGIGAVKCDGKNTPNTGEGGCRCPKIYRPVCGKDGKTYPNLCESLCRKQNIECQGKCPCKQKLPEETPKPSSGPQSCACPMVISPVCGMDGKMYGNACLAHCAKKIITCNRPCPCTATGPVPEIPIGQTKRPTWIRTTGRPTRFRVTRRPTSARSAKFGELMDLKTLRDEKIATVKPSAKYFYVEKQMDWEAASDFCARKGAQLATIHSEEENKHVSNACQGECWIGADRGFLRDRFGWSDESKMVYANWVEGEPKEGLCAQMDGVQQDAWTGTDCKRTLPFVCQTIYDFQLQPGNDLNVDVASKMTSNNTVRWLIVAAIVVVAILAGRWMYSLWYTRKGDEPMDDTSGLSERTPLIEERVTLIA